MDKLAGRERNSEIISRTLSITDLAMMGDSDSDSDGDGEMELLIHVVMVMLIVMVMVRMMPAAPFALGAGRIQ